jgi:hypothetical protein
MLVCTIWRRVFWLNVVPLLCGDAAQVPVQLTAATSAGGLAVADGTAGVTVAAAIRPAKTKARKENDMLIAVLTIAG